jgi:hypothetical protein
VEGNRAAVAKPHLFTSTELGTTQQAAATKAPLTVCETFATAAVALVFIAMLRGHLKRTLCVLFVGLLAFSTEAVILIQTRGINVAASNLVRPFLFNFPVIIISILAFPAVWVPVFFCRDSVARNSTECPDEYGGKRARFAGGWLGRWFGYRLGNKLGNRHGEYRW